jgi:predicted enzyme related to lactoylglutathione lyase
MAPIIYVSDLESEVTFYEKFGFTVSYRGTDFPNFIAVKHSTIEFGIERRDKFCVEEAARTFLWQFVVDDLAAVTVICREHGFAHTQPKCYWVAGNGWSLEVQSPNGYLISLEGPPPVTPA